MMSSECHFVSAQIFGSSVYNKFYRILRLGPNDGNDRGLDDDFNDRFRSKASMTNTRIRFHIHLLYICIFTRVTVMCVKIYRNLRARKVFFFMRI